MRAAPGLWACALAAVLTAGCGDIDGVSQPFPGTILYQDPMGAFEFRLLEPPWIPPFVYLNQTFSVVPPTNATISADPTVLLAEALFSLQFSQVTGDPASAMADVNGTIPGGPTTGPTTVQTASGSSGVEMAWQETTAVYHRDAFLAGKSAVTYRLHFTAKRPIDQDDMVGQMINS